MRFDHGRQGIECLAALLLLLICSVYAAARSSSPFRTFRQCLYLDEDVGPCDLFGSLEHVRLRFCDAYKLAHFIQNNITCDNRALDQLRKQDNQARQVAGLFRQLLDRYDCENNSVTWTCKDCEEAYKQWVCAMYLPQLLMDGKGWKPCRYICRLVEQKCPYFHPSVRDQYAGERVFKCIDPDIPDLDSFQDVSSYGPPNRCYCPQHLGPEQKDSGEAECRFFTQAQLRRNASRRGQHRSGGAPGRPVLLWTLLAALMAAWWTRTR